MKTKIPCFLLTSTGRTVRQLRRYHTFDAQETCPKSGVGYHNAVVPLDVVDGVDHASGDSWPHEDPRWPLTCACGYRFAPDDAWQLFNHQEMARSDGGPLTTIHDAPVGAMWIAEWLTGHYAGNFHRQERGNGPHLIVRTPGGDWDIDAPSSNANGNGWKRSGEPPKVTAKPSIVIGDYHGFLVDGALVEC